MTIQVSELLFYEGEKRYLMNVPSIPDSVIQLIPQEFYTDSTALSRGYVATWEIKENKLYLIDLSSSNYELIKKTPIFADWINKQLEFGTGNKKFSNSYIYLHEYETNIHITIENGIVIEVNSYENPSFNAGPLSL
jgi:hypothetical protein